MTVHVAFVSFSMPVALFGLSSFCFLSLVLYLCLSLPPFVSLFHIHPSSFLCVFAFSCLA